MMRTVYVKTTEACNLNCKHCFTGGDRPPRTFLDLEKTQDWISRFSKYISPDDEVHYEIHGGEPFLAPVDTLRAITKSIRDTKLEHISIGATTNLVYKLKDELLDFIVNDLDSIGTSWDAGIRFANEKQEDLWRKNLQTLTDKGLDVVLNISVSRAVVEMDCEELLKFIRDTKCYKVLFDRITLNGNANNHLQLFPSNAEINDWYLRMHEATEKLGARKWFHNSMLEDVYAKFENSFSACGTFCRDCEERNITLNANGSIGGCPNSAPEEFFGNIGMDIPELFNASKRIDVMVKERTRNDYCYTCPVFSYCGSDCHRLAWDGDVCASPRRLMMRLAGVDDPVSQQKKQSSRVFKNIIPIYSSTV
jgi:radical SAM protein with 4Fe4S-binding SPASM domain